MSKKKHNIPPLQQFLDYIRNRMHPGQRHAFEKQMQKDSFMEEALEGLSLEEPEAVLHRIDALNHNIKGKKNNARILWIAGIAASLALLVITGITFIAIERTRQILDSDILVLEESPLYQEWQGLEEIEEELTDPLPVIAEPIPHPAPASRQTMAEQITQDDSYFIVEAELIAPDTSFPDVKIILPESVAVAEPEVAESNQARGIAARQSARSAEQLLHRAPVKGRVVDAMDGSPIPGVTILAEGTNLSAVTNMDGEFELTLPDRATTRLVVSFIGMQTRRIPATDLAENAEIALENDMIALSEVIVTGYGTRRSLPQDYPGSGYRKSADFNPPEPQGGYRAFRQLMRERAIIPPDAADSRALVVMEFDVDTQGNLSNFRFIRSTDTIYEEMARNILRSAPPWQPATLSGTPLEERVRLRMVFRKQTD